MSNLVLSDAAVGDSVVIHGRDYAFMSTLNGGVCLREGGTGDIEMFNRDTPLDSISFVAPTRKSLKTASIDPLESNPNIHGELWSGTVR